MTRLFRSIRTPTGIMLSVAAAAALLAVLRPAYAAGVGPVAIALALVSVLLRFSRQQDVTRQVSELRARTALQQKAIARLEVDAKAAESYRAQVAGLNRELGELGARFETIEAGLERATLSMDENRSRAASAEVGLAELHDEVRRLSPAVESSADFARHATRQLRSIVDDLEARAPRSDRGEVPAEVVEPVLSIAIPSFNRPDDLRQCLDSIVAAVERTDARHVEVWVTDDCSVIDAAPQLAREFALAHPYIGFRWLPENVGLEANLLECASRCRGEYLWILGCDDLVVLDGFPQMLEDVESGLADVLIYDKGRIDSRGVRLSSVRAGSRPEALEDDELLRLPAPLEFAKLTGILSGLGFISTVVFRRAPFQDIDPGPYMDLTMFPQVAIMLEAFTESEVAFRNTPLVLHRTRSQVEKLGEAVGRPEEGFMAGGQGRDSRFHGAALAAMLQRLCDRSTIEPADFLSVPERLLGQSSMIDWIRRNMERGHRAGLALDSSVVADAERFLAAVGEAPSG